MERPQRERHPEGGQQFEVDEVLEAEWIERERDS
jgi:hypothetical protein